MVNKKSNRAGTGKTHPCKYCNNPIPLYKKYCNRECYTLNSRVIIKCLKCGVEKSLPKNRSNDKFCSKKCANGYLDRKKSHKKSKITLKNRYGVDNPFKVKGYENLNIKRNGEKISKSYQNKPTSEKQKISNKISLTLKNKSLFEKKNIRIKRENTNLKLYNIKSTLEKDSPFREIAEINRLNLQEKKYISWLKNNNLELIGDYKGVKDNKGEIIYYKFKHIPTGEVFVDHLACGRLPIYKDPNSSIGVSKKEQEVVSFIKNNLTSEIITNTRHLVKGFEIDIYVPSLKLAIEFNGNKWHSELNGKTYKYHLYKTQECEKKNIQLIHIFEDEWKYQKEIIKSKILNFLGKTPNRIYARKCDVKPVSNLEKNKFLNDNHLQGEDRSLIKYGLYYRNELVSLITFGRLRKVTGHVSSEGCYELLRFCNKKYYTIVGGFSKLLKFFIKTHTPKKLITFADRRYSQGGLYKKNNFIFVKNTSPNYWYMKYYNQREHRYKYRKSQLFKLLDNFNPDISEWENMKKNGYDRIWDCGSKKYELTFGQ